MENKKIDKLKEIFNHQATLQQRFVGNLDRLVKNQEYININILAMMDELSEAMRETKWKNPDSIEFGWKKTQEFNEHNFKEELVDMLHFFVNLCIAAGMDHNELYDRYLGKNKENHDRQDKNY